MTEPTPDDLARDLAADLAEAQRDAASQAAVDAAQAFQGLPTYTCGAIVVLGHRAREGWPAAIRRALHAEAEAERLQALVSSLADRVAAQSELLARRAERAAAPAFDGGEECPWARAAARGELDEGGDPC